MIEHLPRSPQSAKDETVKHQMLHKKFQRILHKQTKECKASKASYMIMISFGQMYFPRACRCRSGPDSDPVPYPFRVGLGPGLGCLMKKGMLVFSSH